jgi:hypothetical protein
LILTKGERQEAAGLLPPGDIPAPRPADGPPATPERLSNPLKIRKTLILRPIQVLARVLLYSGQRQSGHAF